MSRPACSRDPRRLAGGETSSLPFFPAGMMVFTGNPRQSHPMVSGRFYAVIFDIWSSATVLSGFFQPWAFGFPDGRSSASSARSFVF